MAVAVIVPWRAGCPHRERAWQWVRQRYEAEGFDVVTGSCGAGEWSKATAVADAIAHTSADTLIIADADVWCDGIPDALAAVDGASWVVPHWNVLRLDEQSSTRYMAGESGPHRFAERPYKGRAGGGVVVLHRWVWEQVPMDPRFLGWGGEDDAWNFALSVVFGKGLRLDADLWHLWHPSQPRLSRAVGSEASRALFARYARAYHRPNDMLALIAEAKEALP